MHLARGSKTAIALRPDLTAVAFVVGLIQGLASMRSLHTIVEAAIFFEKGTKDCSESVIVIHDQHRRHDSPRLRRTIRLQIVRRAKLFLST